MRIAALEDRILLLAKKYPKVPVEDIRKLATLDPTDGRYLEWLVRQHPQLGRFLDNMANVSEIRKILEFYQRATKSPDTAAHVELSRDINQVPLSDLHYAYQKYGDEDLESARQKIEKAKQKGSKWIYKEGDYRVLQIGGEGLDPGYAVDAACHYSWNSKWCTTDPDRAESYLEWGPLYIIFKGKEKVMQTDMRNEFKDVTNEPMRFRQHSELVGIMARAGLFKGKWKILEFLEGPGQGVKVPELEPLLLEHGDINTLIEYTIATKQPFPAAEPYFANNAPYAYQYATEVLHGPFPAGEAAMNRHPQWRRMYREHLDELKSQGQTVG